MDMSAESDEQAVETSAPEPTETAPNAVDEVAGGTSLKASVSEAVEASDAGQEAGETTPPVKLKKQRRKNVRGPRKNQPTLRQVTARFAACGRCSYFWVGYRVLQGMDELETAVAQSKSGWLELIWNSQMPELIYKTYGVRLDIAHFHYEGCCKECRRHFIYEAADNEEDADAFRIEISPRMAK